MTVETRRLHSNFDLFRLGSYPGSCRSGWVRDTTFHPNQIRAVYQQALAPNRRVLCRTFSKTFSERRPGESAQRRQKAETENPQAQPFNQIGILRFGATTRLPLSVKPNARPDVKTWDATRFCQFENRDPRHSEQEREFPFFQSPSKLLDFVP